MELNMNNHTDPLAELIRDGVDGDDDGHVSSSPDYLFFPTPRSPRWLPWRSTSRCSYDVGVMPSRESFGQLYDTHLGPHDQEITWEVPQTPPELLLSRGHRVYISGSPIIDALLPETFDDGFQLPEPMIPIDQMLEENGAKLQVYLDNLGNMSDRDPVEFWGYEEYSPRTPEGLGSPNSPVQIPLTPTSDTRVPSDDEIDDGFDDDASYVSQVLEVIQLHSIHLMNQLTTTISNHEWCDMDIVAETSLVELHGCTVVDLAHGTYRNHWVELMISLIH